MWTLRGLWDIHVLMTIRQPGSKGLEFWSMVCAAEVFWDVTITQIGYKATGIMKSLREGIKIPKEVDRPLRITNILGLGRRKGVTEKLRRDQRLEENTSRGMASRNQTRRFQ